MVANNDTTLASIIGSALTAISSFGQIPTLPDAFDCSDDAALSSVMVESVSCLVPLQPTSSDVIAKQNILALALELSRLLLIICFIVVSYLR
jgi:hypothetical protein